MSTYKMLKTQRGVRAGEVHSVVFHDGKTYEIDDDLAAQFKTLDAIEPSSDEPVEALVEDDNVNLHENWLDTDPAVLRHGELTAEQVVDRDESANPQTSNPAKQVEGKAEGDSTAEQSKIEGQSSKAADSAGDATDIKSKKSK